ncbi:MAG TPA: DUF4397 domain-containing protein [Gammaproteobacteria bacterium]|jgi:hypothetical protein
MRLKLFVVPAILAASACLAACDEGRVNPPDAGVRVVHAAPNLGPVVFRRVQANATTLNYRVSAGFSFDVDEYTFSLSLLAIDGSVDDTLTFTRELVEGSEYTFLLREVGGVPQVRVTETDAPGSSVGAGNSRLAAIHAAPSFGPIDFFVDAPGFDPSAATPWGSIDYDEDILPEAFAAANYEIVLTEAGNPANVLLRSEQFALGGSQNLVLVIMDGAGQGLAPIAITVVGAGDAELVDGNLDPGIRVINAVDGGGAIDAGIDTELDPPVIANVASLTMSDYATIPAGDHELNVTPAGNPGVLETEAAFTAPLGRLGTWLVSGEPGTVFAGFDVDDRRVLPNEAKLNLYDGSTEFDNVDVFIVEPGTDIDGVDPTMVTGALGTRVLGRRFVPGNYELILRETDTDSVVGGPVDISLADGGYYSVLLTNAAGGGALDVTLLDDFTVAP